MLEMETLFNSIFYQKLDIKKINFSLQRYGESRVLDVLNYLLINPPSPTKKKKNPYGLIYYLCKNGVSSEVKRLWR